MPPKFSTQAKPRMNKNKKRQPKPSKNLVKTIQSVINKNTEDKISFGNQSNVYYNSGINSSADCIGLVTNIGIGSADNQRVGDQIRMNRHTIKGCLQLASGNVALINSRIAVRLMVVSPKQYSNNEDAIAAGNVWTSYLLKIGGATTGFTGILRDLWSPINTDAITKYYDKIFYLNTSWQATASGYASNPDSIKFFNINLSKKNKLLKYDANVNAGLTPTNYAPIIIMGYVKLDGSPPDTVSTIVSLSYDTVLNFQDL